MADDIKLPEPDISMFGIGDCYRADIVARLIAEARAEEREACAKLCDAADKSTHPADLADRIRARSTT